MKRLIYKLCIYLQPSGLELGSIKIEDMSWQPSDPLQKIMNYVVKKYFLKNNNTCL